MGEERGGLLLGGAVAPRPGGPDGDAAADPEERDAADRDAVAVEDVGRRPFAADPRQFPGRLVIPRDQHGGLLDGLEHPDAGPDPAP